MGRRIRLPELDFSTPREESRARIQGIAAVCSEDSAVSWPPRVQSLRKHHEPRRSRSCRWSLRAARSRASFAYADTEQRQERSLQKLTQLRSFSSFRPNSFSLPEQE